MNMKIKKVGKSKFGFYLMDEDSKFKSTTEAVSKFLESQLPCEIEITDTEGEGKKLVVTRVKVLGKTPQDNSMNEFEAPVETTKPGQEFVKAENYKPAPNYYETQNKTQVSIESQMSIYAAIQMIEAHNKISDTKIELTMSNILNNAQIVKNVLNELKKESVLPDY